MKNFALILLLTAMANPAVASLQECKILMKQANQVCKDDVGCKINFLDVSGAQIVQTVGSVVCKGEKNLIHSSKKSSNSTKVRSVKSSKRELKF